MPKTENCDTDYRYTVTANEKSNHVILFPYPNDDDIILEFEDYFGDNPGTFVRYCKNQTFHYVNGVLDICIKDKPTRFFRKPITRLQKLFHKFLTLDIETKNVNGVLTPIIVAVASQYTT
jgi:hypothetical protein